MRDWVQTPMFLHPSAASPVEDAGTPSNWECLEYPGSGSCVNAAANNCHLMAQARQVWAFAVNMRLWHDSKADALRNNSPGYVRARKLSQLEKYPFHYKMDPSFSGVRALLFQVLLREVEFWSSRAVGSEMSVGMLFVGNDKVALIFCRLW